MKGLAVALAWVEHMTLEGHAVQVRPAFGEILRRFTLVKDQLKELPAFAHG